MLFGPGCTGRAPRREASHQLSGRSKERSGDMKGLSRWFLLAAITSVVVGMAWGVQMAASHDHTLSGAHAHLNLVGWVSFSIFAFYYHLVPQSAEGWLPKLHFALSAGGLVLFVPGIVMAIQERGEALVGLGALLTLAGMLTFLAVVLRGGARRPSAMTSPAE